MFWLVANGEGLVLQYGEIYTTSIETSIFTYLIMIFIGFDPKNLIVLDIYFI